MKVLILAAALGAAPTPDQLRAKCEGGDLEACYQLGVAYADGKDVERDDKKAFGLFQTACTKNVDEACTQLGVLHAAGRGTPKDEAKAFGLWDKTCEKGSVRACTEQGSALLTGKGVEKDPAKGEALLSRICAKEHVPACLRAATYLTEEAEAAARDAPRGVRLLSEACALGEPVACLRACEAQLDNRTVTRSEAEALPSCERACEKKVRVGCWYLGLLHLHGSFKKASPKKGLTTLTQACKDAEPRSCITLAELSQVGGAGQKKSEPKAKDLYETATLRLATLCGKNNPAECVLNGELAVTGRAKDTNPGRTADVLEDACAASRTLGCYGAGLVQATGYAGRAKDPAAALAAWKKGCESGWAKSCRAAGLALLKGEGVPASEAEAKPLLDKACTWWEGDACAALADLAGGKKTPEGKRLRKEACRHGVPAACK